MGFIYGITCKFSRKSAENLFPNILAEAKVCMIGPPEAKELWFPVGAAQPWDLRSKPALGEPTEQGVASGSDGIGELCFTPEHGEDGETGFTSGSSEEAGVFCSTPGFGETGELVPRPSFSLIFNEFSRCSIFSTIFSDFLEIQVFFQIFSRLWAISLEIEFLIRIEAHLDFV